MAKLTKAQGLILQTGFSPKQIRKMQYEKELAEKKSAERHATEERRRKARIAKTKGFVGPWTADDETRRKVIEP